MMNKIKYECSLSHRCAGHDAVSVARVTVLQDAEIVVVAMAGAVGQVVAHEAVLEGQLQLEVPENVLPVLVLEVEQVET